MGYQINDKTTATVGYYHQNGDVGEASGSGASVGLNYDITNNLTAGLKVSYDDAFETRVMATINWSFADLLKGDEAKKEAAPNKAMKALNASPEQRDVRVHDALLVPNWNQCLAIPGCNSQLGNWGKILFFPQANESWNDIRVPSWNQCIAIPSCASQIDDWGHPVRLDPSWNF